MRSVLSISLPLAKKKEIIRRAKKAGKTVSTYILEALALEKKLISEDELLEMVKEGRAEHEAGKTKVLNSLADLMK